MAEVPPGQKRKHDEPDNARKRRRVRSSAERPAIETASSLGGVAVFKTVWGAWRGRRHRCAVPARQMASVIVFEVVLRVAGAVIVRLDEPRAPPVLKVRSGGVSGGGDRGDFGARDGGAILGRVATAESPLPGTETGGGTTPSRTPPIMPQDVYARKLVAFTPDKEKWMKAKAYRPIGTTFIIGQVYRQVKKGKNASLFEIRWLDSQFQSAVEHISVGAVQFGIKNYVALTLVKNPDWRILVRPDLTEEIAFEKDDSDCKEEVLEAFDPSELLPTSLTEVEAIRRMRFVPSGEVKGPSYLYEHGDGSTKTYLRSLLWRHVLHETNKYAVVNSVRVATPFTLDELMIFLGILFYMATNDEGGQYIHVGRNVALDEASVACRSRQGRHMIVYNPMKPTATSWIA
uniref:PiggyBac transposable element-derived protein domain-containing protein n=1 Tax=Phytophthora ramorum TaxID=164328 RepID=H3GV98_PHYRM